MTTPTTLCADFGIRLSAYLDNEAPDAIRREVEAHLSQCPSCTQLRQDLLRDRELFRAVPDDAKASETFTDAVMRQVAAPPAPARRRQAPDRERRSSFTLGHLLATLAIIGILATFLFPVFARAREKARTASCMSNLKQIAFALQMYALDYDGYLPMAWNWQEAVMPYAKNEQLFVCPETRDARPHYSLVSSLGGAKLADIPDPRNTVLAYEGKDGVASKRHHDGCNVAFADGHVKWVRDPERYELGSADGGQPVAGFPAGGDPAPASDRRLAYNAQVTVQAPDVARALYRAEEIVAAYRGFVLSSHLQADEDGRATAQLTFRVPRADLSATVTEVSQLGLVRVRTVNGQDLTGQYVQSIRALQRTEDEFAGVRQVRQRRQPTRERLDVESRLQSIRQSGLQHRTELTSTLAQTDLATVAATFVQPEPQRRREAFALRTALSRPLRSLGGVGRALAVVCLWTLVYLPLWGPVAGIVVWRRRVAARRGGW
jgi:prepilin-type processing-associated H-X9-DG protein